MIRSIKAVCLTLSLLSLSFIVNVSAALQAITQSQFLIGNQSLVSEGGNFELGFFQPGKAPKFYIGIWYKKIPKKTVIWVANRDEPVGDKNITSFELKLAEDGNLVLLNHLKVPQWSSNMKSSAAETIEAVLLDTGNLVLREQQNSSMIVWQSFDHPTDTWVPGSWLGMNKVTGEYQALVSWKNTEDPAKGIFTITVDRSGHDEFLLLWNQTQIYWRTGIWNGHYFPLIPEMTGHSFINVTFVENAMWKRVTLNVFNRSTITRRVIDLNGQLKQLLWLDSIQDWSMFWSAPMIQCDVYLLCGVFGVCNQKSSSPPCSCPHGFKPAAPRDWERNDWSAGCQRITELQCKRKDQFYVMPDMQLPADSQLLGAQSFKECKLACLSRCSCTAYAYDESNQCLIWKGKIYNLQQLDGDNGKSLTLYLRVQGLKSPNKSNKHEKVVLVALSVVSVFLITLIIIVILLARRHQGKSVAENKKEPKGSLIVFSYADLRHATLNFSDKLGGGSFGSVYQGTLKDSTTVAVKRLEGFKQGDKQFRTEVSTLGLIQHVNLVQLIGFCSEGSKRLLVYEFLSNGSLDSFLFRDSSRILNWRNRYEIIFGIARGLAYLHEECRECIIHCDIKPENILLDEHLRPKIADFGMAKLIGRDISRVLTTMRGTLGYLAPEWLSGLPITPKADVYSFGMMVFELISGRRNSGTASETEKDYFPAWAASMTIIEGDLLGLVDERIKDDVDMIELARVCKVACWCIQDWEGNRPSMSLVAKIMEGVVEMSMPPLPKSLQPGCYIKYL